MRYARHVNHIRRFTTAAPVWSSQTARASRRGGGFVKWVVGVVVVPELVSSTFRDYHAEWDAIARLVTPPRDPE